jgi:hypothetical protein
MAYCGPRGIALSTFLRWAQADQDAALEWAAHEARRCGTCGTHPDDWADDPHAHHAHLSEQCPGCLVKHRRTEQLPDSRPQPGVHVVLPRGPAKDCRTCNPQGPRAT